MNRRYQVAMVAALPYPSGQGTQALIAELARGLISRGHRVHLICYHHGAFQRLEPFPIHRIRRVAFYRRLRSGPDVIKPVLDVLLALQAVQTAREQGCGLIHAHNYEGCLAGAYAARVCRLPLVYHAHNLMEDELPRYFRGGVLTQVAKKIGFGLDRTIPRLADSVIAIHQRLGAALQNRGVPAGRIQVVEPGIDVNFWGQAEARREKTPTLAYTGNLDGYQDLAVLFHAMPRVVAKFPRARLLLATPNDPRDGSQLVRQFKADSFTQVVFAPEARAARRVLQRAWVAVCPRSSWSGFPIKNLNAQAAGLPVVACQGSAFGIEPGQTGVAVPDHDPAALAAALIHLLGDPGRAQSLGEAGRRLMNDRFSRERMVDRVEGVWKSVLGES